MKRMGSIILKTMRSATFVDILKDIAQIFFAAMFVEYWVNDHNSVATMLVGLFIAMTFWVFSLWISSNIKIKL